MQYNAMQCNAMQPEIITQYLNFITTQCNAMYNASEK